MEHWMVIDLCNSNKESQQGVRSIDFLNLPAEIRNRIYEYAVTTSDGRSIEIGHRYPHVIHTGNAQLTITRVCRQLRHETLAMFYSMNHFVAYLEPTTREHPNKFRVTQWLIAIGEENAKHIINFTLRHNAVAASLYGNQLDGVISTEGLSLVRDVAKLQVWEMRDRMREIARGWSKPPPKLTM